MKYGIIAGNGRFPVVALEAARRQGDDAVAIAIEEEAGPEVERSASKCYRISLGELSRLIEICKNESITQIMMAGQVKHAKIFSSIRPDWRLAKLLLSLAHEEYGLTDRRGGEGVGGRGYPTGGFDALAEGSAGSGGYDYETQAGCGRTARHRVRAAHRTRARKSGFGAECSHCGACVRSAGGDGRHGRYAASGSLVSQKASG